MAEKGSTNAKRIHAQPDPFDQFRISLGYRVGNLVFTSGQAAIDLDGNIVGVGDFDVQADCVFANLERVLKQGGSSLAQVVKVTIYLTDMSNFPKILELRKKYFKSPWPADTTLEVQSLALPELMIEIEAIGLVDGQLLD